MNLAQKLEQCPSNRRAWRTLAPGGGHSVAALATAAHAAVDDITALNASTEASGLRTIVHFNPGIDRTLGASYGITVERSAPIPNSLPVEATSDLPADWHELTEGLYALLDTWRGRRREHPAIAAVHAVLEKLGQCVATFDGQLASEGYSPSGFMLDGWWNADEDEAVLVLRRVPKESMTPTSPGRTDADAIHARRQLLAAESG
ncbi:MAG: hypothetical protein KF795_17815 [Labilithrix sp.]|nr:hypothetical protein [Labilithrix sp.]